MLRTFAVIATILASAGIAHAEDQIVVTTAGKSPRIVRAELFRAAYTVCTDNLSPLDWATVGDCANASLDDALQQFHNIQRLRAPTLSGVAPR